MVTFVAVVVGCTLALGVRVAGGRLASIGVTAACGAFMAYFLMPPVLSFQVSHPSDLATLAGYGGFGLVLTRASRRKTAQCVDWQDRSRKERSLVHDRSSVASAVETLLTASLGNRLCGVDIEVDAENALIPWAHHDAIRILSAVFTDAIDRSGIQRISIYGGRCPGIHRLIVAAHRVWPTPQNVAITIGKADRDCEPILSVALPRNTHGTWFDNGYARIYQFTAKEPCERRHER